MQYVMVNDVIDNLLDPPCYLIGSKFGLLCLLIVTLTESDESINLRTSNTKECFVYKCFVEWLNMLNILDVN